MSTWSTLLRLLLAAALIFNGAATAAASVHMDHMGTVEAAIESDPAEDPPCHEHHPATAAAADQPDPTVEPDRGQSSSPDCCKSGTCRCACAHHATAAILDQGVVAPIIEHAASVRPMSSGHAAPALPHLIRPPIS